MPSGHEKCEAELKEEEEEEKEEEKEEEEKEAAESEPEIIQRPDTASVAVSNEQSQILIKCSQGFGFFVDR